MASGDDLDALSSKELHDRAMSVARHHLDIAFIWNLLTILPAAETAAGNPGAAELDVTGDPSLKEAFGRSSTRTRDGASISYRLTRAP